MFKKAVWLLFFCLVSASSAEAFKMVSIDGENINMRSGPGEKYSVIWELGRGYPLKIVGNEGKWYKVEDFEGDIGWVYKGLVSRKAHLIVKKKRINIRSGPSGKYRIIGKANYGVVFRTLKKQGGWVKVKHENGLTGWVKRSLLWGW